NGRMAQGVRLIRLDDEQYVSTVAKVKKEPEDIEADEQTTSETSDDVEVVVDDATPGDTIHTEAPEPEEASLERETLREDFMDRVNEDIENEDK
ncbi:TPA: DNA gyrase subunit A, partial [Staphylococcus delphini]|nr:DNA gyrase subunit A [Staphylococcus delphini]